MPWRHTFGRTIGVAGPFASIYERLLCRFSAGFIGWTPYLRGAP